MSLGARIQQRLDYLKMTQDELAKKAGCSQVAIQKVISGKTKKPRNILEIARSLETTPGQLVYGTGAETASNVAPAPDIKALVPVISHVQAGKWTEMDNQLNEPEEWRETTAKVSNSAFALRVVGDSMVNPNGFPSIPEGSVVIVDPELPADNGKIIVARLDDTEEAVLKKLVIDGPNKYLKALNPDYKAIPINGNCTIIGVVKKVEIDL